uniref:Uncharacterized protein n=1 Tax=Candidatus Kentrum sp. LFY TaxID=2126342 RepID=A0A450WVC3_9GAMM|nr:MAG: hypothetical protein BECKLFY1418C_GA0070996_108212 [Candidatus Kentron sp. LFY]
MVGDPLCQATGRMSSRPVSMNLDIDFNRTIKPECGTISGLPYLSQLDSFEAVKGNHPRSLCSNRQGTSRYW